MSNLLKNFLMLVLVLVLVIGAAWFLMTPSSSSTQSQIGIGVTSQAASSTNPADQFSSLINSLSVVDFQGDNPIFNNPIFSRGLTSFTRALPSIDQVRSDPFAPLDANPTLYIHYTNSDSFSSPVASSSVLLPAKSFLTGNKSSASSTK